MYSNCIHDLNNESTLATVNNFWVEVINILIHSVIHKNNYKISYKYILESFDVYPLARKYPSHNDSKNEPFYDKLNN